MIQEDLFKKIIAHSKEYGFIFPSSEIYDGLSAVYDYGQNGVELKNNIRRYWWESMVRLNENIVGLDAAIFMHPRTWEASGHVAGFNDPMVDCKKCRRRFRADQIDLSSCPECGGDLLVRFGRFGKFIACNNFPKCKYTEKTTEEKKVEDENSGEVCPECGAPMVVKRGKYGAFLGCSKYPDCKGIKKITSDKTTGVKCPKCQNGEILERRSRKGRLFYGCSAYPKCDFSLWNRPSGKTCEKCGSLMVFQMKGTEKCSNKECK